MQILKILSDQPVLTIPEIVKMIKKSDSATERAIRKLREADLVKRIGPANYIVAHELVHLVHKNHTKAFWNEVDKVIPNFQRHIEWLRFNSAAMDL